MPSVHPAARGASQRLARQGPRRNRLKGAGCDESGVGVGREPLGASDPCELGPEVGLLPDEEPDGEGGPVERGMRRRSHDPTASSSMAGEEG